MRLADGLKRAATSMAVRDCIGNRGSPGKQAGVHAPRGPFTFEDAEMLASEKARFCKEAFPWKLLAPIRWYGLSGLERTPELLIVIELVHQTNVVWPPDTGCLSTSFIPHAGFQVHLHLQQGGLKIKDFWFEDYLGPGVLPKEADRGRALMWCQKPQPAELEAYVQEIESWITGFQKFVENNRR